MIQLTYVSEASSGLAPDELFSIIETSSRNNLRDGLTGFLVYARDRFFQIVEGQDDPIEALLSRLTRDRRHSNIAIVSRASIAARSFPRWQMKRLAPGNELWRALAAGSTAGHLDPKLRDDLSRFLEARVGATA